MGHKKVGSAGIHNDSADIFANGALPGFAHSTFNSCHFKGVIKLLTAPGKKLDAVIGHRVV